VPKKPRHPETGLTEQQEQSIPIMARATTIVRDLLRVLTAGRADDTVLKGR